MDSTESSPPNETFSNISRAIIEHTVLWFSSSFQELGISLASVRVMDDNETVNISSTSTVKLNISSSRSLGYLILIPVHVFIFLFGIIGNAVVVLTLALNRNRRTITDIYLMNLAVSDMLLCILCIPFTLIGTYLRNFVFGRYMCKVIPYLQGTSISVSSWTLVAIALARYFAICDPLHSNRWQTFSHTYKVVAAIWLVSLICLSPIAFVSDLIPLDDGRHKCGSVWPGDNNTYECCFSIFLDLILMLLPLGMLSAAYYSITRNILDAFPTEPEIENAPAADSTDDDENTDGDNEDDEGSNVVGDRPNDGDDGENDPPINRGAIVQIRPTNLNLAVVLRRTNMEKTLRKRRRVIRMVIMLVLKYLICWSPLHVINTITAFDSRLVSRTIGNAGISFCQLLAYSSSCCNPIHYCFMNTKFHQAFSNMCNYFRGQRRQQQSPNNIELVAQQ